MTKYEELLDEAADEQISVDENYHFKSALKGLYVDQNIALSDKLETSAEKACVLAEELGHHHTTVGNILDSSDFGNAKQEHQARVWSYNRLIGLSGLVNAYLRGCRDFYEVADFLGVTEEYLREALECYRAKYGTYTEYKDYYICFEPCLVIGRK